MRETVTTNLADFGTREIAELRDILDAWLSAGLPDDFYGDGVHPVFNKNSGFVFLTNAEFQVAMMNGDRLESFYSSPYEGREGFFEELFNEFDDMHPEDKTWFSDIAKARGINLPEGGNDD